jgi:hypothetical protein
MLRLAFLSLVLSAAAHAEGETHVSVGAAFPPGAQFPVSPHAEVHRRETTKRNKSLPDPETRHAAFARVNGLADSIANLDEVDRDLLYVRARSLPPKELAEKYPKIPAAQLDALRKSVKEKP